MAGCGWQVDLAVEPRSQVWLMVVLPLALAVPPSDFCQLNVDIPDAVIRIRSALPGLARLRPQAAQRWFVDMEHYDGVELYALALTRTRTRCTGPSRGRRRKRAF